MGLFDWFTGANPAAAVAEGAIEGLLGKVDAIIQDFHLPPEKALQYEQAKAQLRVDAIRAQFAAVDSARQMQMTTRSYIPGILAILVTSGFFGLLTFLALHPATDINRALDIMLGSLGGAWLTIIAFYFGSSSDSHTKTTLLGQVATPPKA